MKLNYPEIKDWCICEDSSNPFLAPELRKRYIHGAVYNSERFRDGAYVNTSRIRRIFEEQGVLIVETRNSKYILRAEEVNESYEMKFGNVFEKLRENGNVCI